MRTGFSLVPTYLLLYVMGGYCDRYGVCFFQLIGGLMIVVNVRAEGVATWDGACILT